MHAPTGTLASLLQSPQECPSILIVLVNGLPPITAVKHVVEGPWEFDASFTRHVGMSSEMRCQNARAKFYFLDLTPLRDPAPCNSLALFGV